MTHHEDCDGYRMHSVGVRKERYSSPSDSFAYIAYCPICGDLPCVGTAGSEITAKAIAGPHSFSVECTGECKSWN